jgi:4-diphosphocytidyl-2-C-methyl-D-erythritol kinase
MTAPLVAPAPAKINLTLRVGLRRPDGFHEIESLVVFAGLADEVSLDASRPLGLDVDGPLRDACGPSTDNLVLKAARALAAQVSVLRSGHFTLTKRIPVAAGLGGGSADAAAALRLLAQLNDLALDDVRLMTAARVTGADVPVCLDPRPRMMRGIGEVLSGPLALPKLPAVLVNPRVAVPTKDVFMALRDHLKARSGATTGIAFETRARWKMKDLVDALVGEPNDLEAPAVAIAPVIAQVLADLNALKDCRLARMSGSGATCFGLFGTAPAAAAAARALRAKHPDWWVRATKLG